MYIQTDIQIYTDTDVDTHMQKRHKRTRFVEGKQSAVPFLYTLA